jgi:hypothetical protein
MDIEIPEVKWALGDPEKRKNGKIVVEVRPLYYHVNKDDDTMTRIGEIDPKYSGIILDALGAS